MLSVPPPSSLFNYQTLSLPKPSKSLRYGGTVRASAAGATTTTTRTTSYIDNRKKNSSYMAAASFYEILGIPSAATCQEIKAAYRRLARVCHPDVAAIDRKDSSADEFMMIHNAYSTLSDPAKRADYDRRVLLRRRPMTAYGASGFSGGYNCRRNWETDQCW